MADQFDVIVLGGGPGGYPAAIRAAQLGRRVAIVEGERLGGICLHRGCIPTKALLHVAETLRVIRESDALGIQAGKPRLDPVAMASYRDGVVKRLYSGVQRLMRQYHIALIQGWGRLTEPTSLEIVDDAGEVLSVVSATDVILATGSRPRELPGLPFDGLHVLSSDHAVSQMRLPNSIMIVGSGAVGTEFASFYIDAGVPEVTLIELLPRVLPSEDTEVSAEVERQLKARGVRVLTSASLRSETVELGEGAVACEVVRDGITSQVRATAMLIATGRQANIEFLGLAETGVAITSGYVKVDPWMRTNVPHVYAVGDMIGGLLLAHKATAEGRLAAEVIAGAETEPIKYNLVPRCTYSYPEVASFGLSEADAVSEGRTVKVSKFPLAASARAAVERERSGFVKFVIDASTEEILGVHAVGPRVTELIANPAVAAHLESTPYEIARSIYPHPTLSEAFNEAANALYGTSTHG